MSPQPAKIPRLDSAACSAPHARTPSFSVLTAVRLVCRACLPTSGGNLPHVMRLLDAFLDEFSDTLTLARGYLLSDGSLRLLQYLAAREDPTMDPILRRWAFNDVVGYAAAKGDVETLQWLLESYLPDEFLTKAVAGAASGGHVIVLEWLWANHRVRGYWGSTEMGRAVRNKHSAVLAWLQNHVAPRPESAQKVVKDVVCSGNLVALQWMIERFDLDINRAFAIACSSSQWELACWILEHCELETSPVVPYTTQIPRAVVDGNLRFLKLASSLNLWTPKDDILASRMIPLAAGGGHLEVLKWLHEDCDINWVGDGCVRAARGGHVAILKYLYEEGLVNHNQQSPMDVAARSGFLDVVQWLHANSGQGCTTNAMDWAAESGHLEVVQWLHENRKEGCTSAAMHLAAANGHMAVVKWLHANRSEGCQELTLSVAAEHGRLEVVQWLFNNVHNYFYAPQAMNTAAMRGYLDVVQWLHGNRRDGCTFDAMNGAASNGHLEVVKWLYENRSEGCLKNAMDNAATNGHLKIVQWLHENRHEGCSVKAMDGAAMHGDLKLVKWLHENRSEGCSKRVINNAAYGGHLKVMKWLRRNRSEGCTSGAIQCTIRKGFLDVAAFLHAEYHECRRFEARFPLQLDRIEVAEWVLENFPQEFKSCVLNPESGDWYFFDWMEKNAPDVRRTN